MNKKMKMFIICAVIALIISCKNYAISKDSENSEQSEQKVKSPKQIEQEIKKEFNGLLNILETKDLSKLDVKDTKEIKKTIKDLREQIEKTDAKKTSLLTYSEYEKKVQEIIEKLKDTLKDKGELENKLKELEESLKKKKEERKQKLEEAKKKFEEFKGKVDTATGVSSGDQSRNKGQVGQQAWTKAKEFGLTVKFSGVTDTGDMSSGIIADAVRQIDEELKIIREGTQISEKKK
ncbi:ErpL protein [Borreliella garinii]|uniref:ErpL protein n=2 Tax=Borreliella garinii TaxID=29519 RepID=UPI001AEEAE51|nr:ErpL protein [Borreliella garinii]